MRRLLNYTGALPRLLALVVLLAGVQARAQFTFTWINGTIPASLLVSGQSMLITTTAEHDFNLLPVINQGTIEWAQGRLRSGNGGSISNQGTWNDTGSSTLGGTTEGASAFKNDYGGSFTFTNTSTGTYNKTGSGDTHFHDVGLFNDGAINVGNGKLFINGGGTNSSTGTIVTAAGASTIFSNSYTLATGSSLTGAGTYLLSGGTLTATGNVTISNLSQTGGVLGGTHNFTDTTLNWTGGNWSTSGTTTLAASSTLNVSGAADHDFNSRSLLNQGTVNWSGGRFRSGNGGSIANDGQWNDTGTSILGGTSAGASAFKNDYGGSYTFTNSSTSTYTKSGTGTTTFQDVGFFNAGAVNVNAGTLVINGGGTNTGTITTAAGATLNLSNSYTLASGSSLLGSGTIQATGATLTLNGAVTLFHLLLNGAVLAGTHSFAGNMTWNTGNWNTSGTTTNPFGSSLNIATTADHDFNTRLLVNAGTVNWSAGRLRSGNSGSITNDGQWNDTSTSILSGTSTGASAFKNDYGGSYTFTNSGTGTYTKSGTGITSFQDVGFFNAGAINVNAGTLLINGGGTNTGTITTAAGATFNLSNSYTLAHGSSLLGAGSLDATGGTLTLTGTVSLSHLRFLGANLAGTHSLAGDLTWNNGNFNTTGTTTNLVGSTFTVAGAADHDFNSRALLNQGTVTWTGGRLRSGNGGSITNEGLWYDLGTSTLGGTSAGASALKNDYGGSYTFTNSAGSTYHKAGTGLTTFQDVALTNAGEIHIDAGTLSLGAGLSLAPTSVFRFSLGGTAAGTDYGLVSVSSSLALSGALALDFSGGFESTVTPGDTFTLLTAGTTLTGGFANIASGQRLWTSDGLGSFEVFYGVSSPFATNSLVLTNFTPVPEPSTWALLLLGGTSLVLAARRRA